jgi:glutathione S-transferase
MARKIKLYMFTGSAPSMSAQLMLEHKGLDHKAKHLMVGPHAFGMLGRGFQTMTVPALKIDGRRVQGSRDISRALDELVRHPPLFPAEPERRRAVEQAERWGEEFQDVVRRFGLCAAQREPGAFSALYRHPNPLMRPASRMSRGLTIRLASAGHKATDRNGAEGVAGLPDRLDQIDAWIDSGVLNGPELNAADFQIAPNIALIQCFEDLAPLVAGRPAARLAARVVPDFPGEVGPVLPAGWLAAPAAAVSAATPPDLMGPGDVLRAIGYDEHRVATALHQHHA